MVTAPKDAATPRPWVIVADLKRGGVVVGNEAKETDIADVASEADAELMCRAVNAHDALVLAVRRLMADRHTHAAGIVSRDACVRCGRDIRDDVHFRKGESAETDREQARAALALAGVES